MKLYNTVSFGLYAAAITLVMASLYGAIAFIERTYRVYKQTNEFTYSYSPSMCRYHRYIVVYYYYCSTSCISPRTSPLG